MNTTMLILMFIIGVFGVANFIVYALLSKYLWISAGVKKSDVRRFNSEHPHRTQRRMSAWLIKNAKHPKEFAKMFAICNVVIFFCLVSFSIVFFVWRTNNLEMAKIAAAAIAALSAVTWAIGFSYGKRIEADFGDYFSSPEYTPYEGESIDTDVYSESEYYEDEPQESSMTDEQRAMVKKSRIIRYFIRLIVVVIILLMAFSPYIFNKYNIRLDLSKLYKSDEQQTQSNASYGSDNLDDDYYMLHKDKSAVTYDEIKSLISDTGYELEDYSKQASADYPEYSFSECYAFGDDAMHFEYLVLDSADSAEKLQKELQSDIKEKYKKGADGETEQKDSDKDFRLYILETSEGYAVSIYAQNIVIYAYCEPINATWLKFNLNTIGYLEEF